MASCSLLLLHSTTAFLLAPRAPPHIERPAVPPRAAAINAMFGFDNENDFRRAAAATLASVVILASPTAAFAKGGGHGGGGGGGGGGGHSYSSHSSKPASRSLHSYSRYASPKVGSASTGRVPSSSSRRRRDSFSSSSSWRGSTSAEAILSPPPPPALLFPTESQAREEGGYYCPTEPPLPKAGEKLNVNGRKATVLSSSPQVALYGSKLQTIPGIDSDCSVTVQYADDGATETLSAAEKPEPLWVTFLGIGMYAGLYGAPLLLDATTASSWEAEKKRHERLVEELEPASSIPLITQPREGRPKSGEYWGSSEESDDGDQSVRSTITFEANGAVRGRGNDGEDGPYVIKRGVWGKRAGDEEHEVTVGWIEEYSEGFTVVVEGFYDAKTGKIEGRFLSSRGIRGRFMLAPKPAIF